MENKEITAAELSEEDMEGVSGGSGGSGSRPKFKVGSSVMVVVSQDIGSTTGFAQAEYGVVERVAQTADKISFVYDVRTSSGKLLKVVMESDLCKA